MIWYSQVHAFFRAVTSGSWPLWDPCTSFGVPLLANPNTQVLYPFTWLHLLFMPWTVYTVYVVLHLVLSALGMMRLGERLGLSRAAAFLAATLWVTGGTLLSLISMWNHF